MPILRARLAQGSFRRKSWHTHFLYSFSPSPWHLALCIRAENAATTRMLRHLLYPVCAPLRARVRVSLESVEFCTFETDFLGFPIFLCRPPVLLP